MANSVESMGLRVESISPQPYMVNVSVNDSIQISFNSDLNTSSIVSGIKIHEDKFENFTDANKLGDVTLFPTVDTSVTYKDRIVVLKPTSPLKEGKRYTVHVSKNTVKDIRNRPMLDDFTTSFVTESESAPQKCVIESPLYGGIFSQMPIIKWLNLSSLCYVVQISKTKTFESILFEENITQKNGDFAITECLPSLTLSDGSYYIRVKAIGGEWSDHLQIFIKREEENFVSFDDSEDIFGIYDEKELEILEMFPNDKEADVSVMTNIIYLKVRGKVSYSDIDFSNTFVLGELSDKEDEDLIEPQGQLKGRWIIIYDEENNESYIIFIPESL